MEWTKGELEKSVTVDMADWYEKDTEVKLQLLAEQKAYSSTTTIACVGEVENSSTNPYWIGERSADTLAWGEWTMDLDAATQKVAAAEGDAYTLILVGGSKWCPDCVKVDRWLLDQSAFADWARSRKVSCVTIDLPKVSADDIKSPTKTLMADSPSLLRYEPYTASDRYVNACADGEASRVQSGAGYLSRHGIPMTGNGGTNATAVAERNARLFMTSTLEGGLCRPDCIDVKNEQTMQFKTGIPCLIVMDKTGRVIGRNFQFNNESPDKFEGSYIDRMNELLAQKVDPAEEQNDSRWTTEEILPLRASTGEGEERKKISYNDVSDWYRVGENALGAKVVYRLWGDAAAEVKLSVVEVDGKAEKTLGEVRGFLNASNIVLTVDKIPSTNCYVRVSAPLTSSSWGVTYGYFALTNTSSTVAAYELTSDGVLLPEETVQTYTAGLDEEMSVFIEIEAGRAYKLSGEGIISDNRLNYNDKTKTYLAGESCIVSVPLQDRSFSYQIWNPGLVAFESDSGDVTEPALDYVLHTIRVKRQAGVSGRGGVRVDIDTDRSTALTDLYEFADNGSTNIWEEGQSEDWVLTVKVLANDTSDGEQPLVLKLTSLEGSEFSLGVVSEYVLTIHDDNDPALPGKVGIVAVSPAKVSGDVYAKSGSEVLVSMSRTGGSDGFVGCSLAATGGATFDQDSFSWRSRDNSVKTARLSLDGVLAGSTVKVVLTPDMGCKAVYGATDFSIKVVAEDAPNFATNDVSYTVYRTVAMAEAEIPVEIGRAGVVSVSKVSGTVPGGIRAVYDEVRGSLVFSGVATAAVGTYSAVYRVTCGGVKGLVVSVVFRVVDPVKTSTQTGSSLNSACAKTRTFSDLQVYSDKDWSRLVGLVTLTIPSTGRLSAKYVCASGTVSLLARNWSSGQTVTDGVALTADLVGTTKKTEDYSMTVTAFPDGSLTCFFRDPAYHGEALSILRPGDDWSSLDAGAAEWEGYYTVSLAQRDLSDPKILAKGDGYMTLKMTSNSAIRKGKMAYAGLLPNGKAFSGARTLWGYYMKALKDMALAYLPVFNVSSSDDVSGLVLILPDAKEKHQETRRSVYNDENTYELFNTNKFIWVSKASANAGKAYESEFDVYGGYYNADEDFAGCCVETFETDLLTFFAMPQLLDPDSSWSTNDTQVSAARTAKGLNNLALAHAKNDQNLTLTFNRVTGLVSGALDLTIDGQKVRAAYKGVVMPGWGTASCAECGRPTEAQKRPFVSGSCFFNWQENASSGRALKYGCPFSIGLEEGR